jgi:UDPglucose 6-dehydrogenase
MATIKRLACEHGCLVKMLEAQVDDSSYRSFWPLRKFKELIGREKVTVGVLGLSYKENTHSIKNSASVKFINIINGYYAVKAFDPVVKFIPNLDSQSIMETGRQVIDGCDFLAILTPWPEFSEFDYSKFVGNILDPYSVIKTKPKSATVHTLGEVLC